MTIKNSVKVQASVTGRAAELYKLIGKKSKSSAITAAIFLLARNKRLKEIFFADIDAVNKVLANGDDPVTDKAAAEQEDGWS